MKTKTLIFAALTGMLIFNACRKDVSTTPNTTSKPEKRVLSENEKVLKLKLEQSAMIIAEVIKDKSILKELNSQIAKKLTITKSEEALTFKELFSEPDNRKVESSGSASQKVFVMDASIANHFKTSYQKIAKNKTYQHPEKYDILEKVSGLKTQTVDPIEDMLTIDGAELYFPYSENFTGLDYNPTITSHPIDENEGNDGYYWDEETSS